LPKFLHSFCFMISHHNIIYVSHPKTKPRWGYIKRVIRVINMTRVVNLQFWQLWHVLKLWKKWIRSIQVSNSPRYHILSIVNHNEKESFKIFLYVVCAYSRVILTSQWGSSKVKFQKELAHSNHSLGLCCENI